MVDNSLIINLLKSLSFINASISNILTVFARTNF
mgnify:CR=1 FL=1